ncbi:MAG: aldo/keto reductase [Prevotellaceae bacterium]|jgi:diketogulonate reductase-like aldo/keto reductase|nr:aldo/keto reductase [Prevotellaceae bacterium]
MKNFKLNNGLDIPSVGLGVFRLEDNKEAQKVVELALSVGYRRIDTAMVYQNEEAVGKAIKASGIACEKIFVTTKLWNENQRKGDVQEAFEESLHKLELDYIDLYLIHWPVPGKFVESWKVLEKIYKSGKAKAIGVSNFKRHHLEELKKASDIIPAVNQVELRPYLSQELELEYCDKEGIVLEAWSPFTAGKTGLLKDEVLLEIAERYAKSTAQIVLRWSYQRGVITIPKSSHKQRLEENIHIFDFELTESDMNKIAQMNVNKRIGPDLDNFDF